LKSGLVSWTRARTAPGETKVAMMRRSIQTGFEMESARRVLWLCCTRIPADAVLSTITRFCLLTFPTGGWFLARQDNTYGDSNLVRR
jgi:hypothetical protein